MKCPHCQTEIFGNPMTVNFGVRDPDGAWGAAVQQCPVKECRKVILEVVCADAVTGRGQGFRFQNVKRKFLGYPRGASRPSPPPEVPQRFADDYKEASLVLADSPKASAALSRRCLQDVLREKAGVTPSNLSNEIEQVITAGNLPSQLSEAIDAVRNIGNFAAHPIKSTASREVVPVEPVEADWNLDVLDGLFDFFFVQPERLKKRRAALDKKLADAGKAPMK